MNTGEVPAEGWRAYLKQEEMRLLAERYQCPRPPTPMDPLLDSDFYFEQLVATSTGETFASQVQVDWDRFVTFADLPTPESRSATPSPILPALNRPLAPLMQRHTTGSPRVVRPHTASARRSRTRVALREALRQRLASLPLTRTAEGRQILQVSRLCWYRTPSNFAAVWLPEVVNTWRPNDVANYILWLDRDICVHRSNRYRIVCIEQIDKLNAVLLEQGHDPVEVTNAPAGWLADIAALSQSQRGLPHFMRAGYTRRDAMQSALRERTLSFQS